MSKEEKNILQNLKAGRFSEVEQIAFTMEEETNESEFRDMVFKVTRFWVKREELLIYTNENSGESLFKEWELFIDFCCDYQVSNQYIFLAIKSFILKKVIDFLSKASREVSNTDSGILILLAYAFYEADIIDKATETLEYILTRFPDLDDARVFVLLGDIYAIIYPINHQHQDYSVIMFNELFLKAVDRVDIESIEYVPIQKLIQGIKNDTVPENLIKYWISVYGYLYGGLSVRRNLRYEEYKKLQELIGSYESEVRAHVQIEVLIPKLLNVYFWVFDYYIYQMKTMGGAQQICRRIMELLAILYQEPGYEEMAKKLGLQAERVLDMLLQAVPQ